MKIISHLKLENTSHGHKVFDESKSDYLFDHKGDDTFFTKYKAVLLAAQEADAIVRKGALPKYGYLVVRNDTGNYVWCKDTFFSEGFITENEAYADAWLNALKEAARKLTVAPEVMVGVSVMQQVTFIHLTQDMQ